MTYNEFLKEAEKFKSKINPFAVMCQTAHETGYYKSELAVKHNNFAGIKASTDWLKENKPYVDIASPEVINGQTTVKVSKFRKYKDVNEFLNDYVEFISRDRYADVRNNIENVFGYFAGLLKGGWATNPLYFNRLVEMAFKLAPDIFGETWYDKLKASFEYSRDKKRSINTEQIKFVQSMLDKTKNNVIYKPVVTTPSTPTTNTKKPIIVIDPGHGGTDSGAVSGDKKVYEKNINLAVALKVRDLLKDKFDIVMTRETDKFVSLENRIVIANKTDAIFYLSIHTNSATSPSAKGFEVWTSKGLTKSDYVATSIFNEWVKLFPDGVTRSDKSDSDPDKEANFYVIYKTKMPAALVELDFICNPSVVKKLIDVENQNKMATALSNGIKNYFK